MPDSTDKSGKPTGTSAADRRAEALRRNLRRRKEQARARAESQSRPSDSDGKS
jgi:hypothetical protein